ncbi:MAG: hypothetical protein HRU15_14635 [Planctomycetes bacterium]|nr:hypothetical protein [Planctomycetota bacterium]
MRFFYVFFVLLCLSVVAQVRASEDFVLDYYSQGLAVQIQNYQFTGHDRFSLGTLTKNWDKSKRYELVLSVEDYWRSQKYFYGAGYCLWEEHEWSDGNQSVLMRGFGSGMEFGGRFWLFAPRGDPKANIGLSPYGRTGLVLQDVDFLNIPGPTGDLETGVDFLRLEFALGLDAIMTFGKAGHAALGAGALLWLSNESATDVNGYPVQADSFNGDSLYYRMSLGIRF